MDVGEHRYASAAAGSGSAADAGGSRLQAIVLRHCTSTRIVSGRPELVSKHIDVLPKPLTDDLPGLLGIEVGIPRCVTCLLQPRELVARQPDARLDQSEVLGQPLETAKKIDTDFPLPIRDERVLRSEVAVCLLIAYRRNRRDEGSERHPRHEGVKPREAVRYPRANRTIRVTVYLTSHLVAIAGHESIP